MTPIEDKLYRFNNSTAQLIAHRRGGRSYYKGVQRIADSHPHIIEQLDALGKTITADLTAEEADAIRAQQFQLVASIADEYDSFNAFINAIKGN